MKFDALTGSEYFERFVNREPVCYSIVLSEVEPVLKVRKRSRPRVADIGAGPGVLAYLLDKQGIACDVVGFEPSTLHAAGVELAKSCRSVAYTPVAGTFEDARLRLYGMVHSMKGIPLSAFNDLSYLNLMKNDHFDVISFIRSPHEIALSSSRELFLEGVQDVTRYVTLDGALVFSDPQYTLEALRHQDSGKIIDEVRALQQQTIGHSHDPGDYIPHAEISARLSESHRKISTTVHTVDCQYLAGIKEKYRLADTPITSYVLTVRMH